MLSEAGETLRINDIDLFARGFGDPSAPVLVAVHGGPTWDHSYLLPAVARLADARYVVLIDLRGNGRSGRGLPMDRLRPEYLTADLRALADLLNADRIDLLGHSFGGSVAMRFAAEYPSRLRSVILSAACAYDDDPAPLRAAVPEYADRTALAVRVEPEPGDGGVSRAMALASLTRDVWDRSRWPQWREVLARVRFSDDWNRVFEAGEMRRTRPDDPAAALRDCGAPLLIVHGAYDMTFPLAFAERLHAEVPGSRLAVIPHAAHMAHFDNEAAWTTAIRSFLT